MERKNAKNQYTDCTVDGSILTLQPSERYRDSSSSSSSASSAGTKKRYRVPRPDMQLDVSPFSACLYISSSSSCSPPTESTYSPEEYPTIHSLFMKKHGHKDQWSDRIPVTTLYQYRLPLFQHFSEGEDKEQSGNTIADSNVIMHVIEPWSTQMEQQMSNLLEAYRSGDVYACQHLIEKQMESGDERHYSSLTPSIGDILVSSPSPLDSIVAMQSSACYVVFTSEDGHVVYDCSSSMFHSLWTHLSVALGWHSIPTDKRSIGFAPVINKAKQSSSPHAYAQVESMYNIAKRVLNLPDFESFAQQTVDAHRRERKRQRKSKPSGSRKKSIQKGSNKKRHE